MYRIAITTTSFCKHDPAPLRALEEAGVEVALNPHGRKLRAEEVVDIAGGKDGMIAGTETLSREVLNQLPKLKVISRLGAGIDNVDLEAAKELGIRVYKTPFGPTRSVAELTVGLIFDLLRMISRADRELRAGTWEKRMGNLLLGKKVGIVGFGRIGQAAAELLLPFGVEIAYCDPADIETNLPANPMPLDDLLAWADIVTLHVSSSDRIIGREELARMKPNSRLVNLARGGAVDEEALIAALKEGRLAGAALDVYAEEPYKGAFNALDNVVLTPHIGSYALEGRVAMEMQSVQNLLKGLEEAARRV